MSKEITIGTSDHKIWQPGELGVHSKVAYPNATSPKAETAEKVARMNTGEFLLNRFVFDVFQSTTFANGDRVDIGRPSSPYGYGGLMVKVSNEERLRQVGEDKYPTEKIVDYPESTQKEAFRFVLAGIRSVESTLLPDEQESHAVATMNSFYDVSNHKFRMAQSIALPHWHISKLNPNWIRPGNPRFNRLANLEEKILQNNSALVGLTQQVAYRIQDRLGSLGDELSFNVRTAAPFGYEIVTPITRDDDLDTSATFLSRLIAADSVAYGEVAQMARDALIRYKAEQKAGGKSNEEVINRLEALLLPQPSHKMFIYYNGEGNLCKINNPGIFDGSIGPVDSAKVLLKRDPEYKHPYIDEETGRDEMRPYFAEIEAKLSAMLHSDERLVYKVA
jgi:hypothetical protein